MCICVYIYIYAYRLGSSAATARAGGGGHADGPALQNDGPPGAATPSNILLWCYIII